MSIFLVACGHSTASFLAKGEEYLQKRKFHDAMMQFRSAAESDSGSAGAHWGLARSYENLGQFNEVLDELRKTIELDNTNLEAKAKLGSYFLLVQPPMISETEKLRDEILAADPKFIEGHILTATIMAAQGKPDADVIAQVNKAIDLNPQRIESYISLERMYMTREKAPEAEAAIQRGIAANPGSVTGLTEYGRFLMYAARDAEAEAQFQKAIAADGTSIDAHESIAQFYVTSRQFEKAEAAYKNLIQVQDNSPESRLELAEFYSTTERKDEAVAVLEQIIADAPDYVLARYRVGQMYLDRKETAKVYEQLDVLLKINDADTQALMLRSRAKMQDSKPDEAVKDIEDVLKQQPSNRDALYLMAQARLALGQNDQANAFIGDIERFHPTFLKVGLLKIQAAFSAGDAQSALKLSNELIDKTSSAQPNADNTPQIILDLRIKGISSRGLAYLDLGKLAEAKYDLQDVVRLTPRSSGAMVNLAKVFIAERNAAAALDLYEKAYAADAKNFDAISGIVNMAIQMGQTEKAHTRIASFIDANAGKGDVIAALRYLNATVFTAEKNNPAAEKELLAAIELDADYLPAYSAYASLLTSQNRTDEALAQYKKVIEKKPAAQVYTMIGILEDGRGNTAEAEANYRKALDIAPDSAIAANNLAWLLADHSGNLDEALQLASGAVARNQNVAEYYDTLGWVYLKKGLTSPAVEQMKKAVALEESNAKKTGTTPKPDYRNRLAQALAKAGGKPAASV
ncbi:MAG: tetratricopeptide repeat protein [Chloracidobacterium sp.]|nr:tetratricopeptide repeat protein [Chloracidobacterium sp.]